MPRKSTTTGITTEERRVRSERLRSRLLGICEGFEAGASVDVKDREDQISRLEDENERLHKALEWYADYATWEQWSHADQGDRARIALNSAKGQDGAVVVAPGRR